MRRRPFQGVEKDLVSRTDAPLVRGRSLFRTAPVGVILVTATLVGCLAPGGPTGGDGGRLADHTTCVFATADGDRVDCRTPLEPAEARADVPTGWACVGASGASDDAPYRYRVYHHPDREQLGVRFDTTREREVSTGWVDVTVNGSTRSYNYTTTRNPAFVTFGASDVSLGDRASVTFALVGVTYASNRTVLEDAKKRPIWVPSETSDNRTPRSPYWLIHRFDTGDRSYHFSTLDPAVNIVYNKTDFRLEIEPDEHSFGWEGEAIPASDGQCSTTTGAQAVAQVERELVQDRS